MVVSNTNISTNVPDPNILMKDRYSIEEDYFKDNNNDKFLGTFKLTAYCNCSICNGKWAGGPTFSGEMPQANYTLAVDPDIIPLNSEIRIEGLKEISKKNIFKAQDTGSAIIGKRIDVYFNNHQDALIFGVKEAKIYMKETNEYGNDKKNN